MATKKSKTKKAKESKTSKEPEIPPIIKIRKKILNSPGKWPEAGQATSRLLNLPPEILRHLVKSNNLTIFDKACLMLTCKTLAQQVSAYGGSLAVQTEVKTGDEGWQLEMYCEREWEDADFDGSDDEADYYKRCFGLEAEYNARVKREDIADFHKQLESGWYRGQGRFCFGCTKFQSTDSDFWKRKFGSYLYRSSGRKGQALRMIRDCQCGHTPKSLIEPWIKYAEQYQRGVEPKAGEEHSLKSGTNFRYMPCPECVLAKLEPCCDGECYRNHGCACNCGVCCRGW